MRPPSPPDVLVIAASNGQNLLLAERFAAATREQGLRAEVIDLIDQDFPLFTPRAQAAGTPEGVASLQARLAAAPRWVICAPEYNGSIPPVLTSAIAWLSVQGESPPIPAAVVTPCWRRCGCSWPTSAPMWWGAS